MFILIIVSLVLYANIQFYFGITGIDSHKTMSIERIIYQRLQRRRKAHMRCTHKIMVNACVNHTLEITEAENIVTTLNAIKLLFNCHKMNGRDNFHFKVTLRRTTRLGAMIVWINSKKIITRRTLYWNTKIGINSVWGNAEEAIFCFRVF